MLIHSTQFLGNSAIFINNVTPYGYPIQFVYIIFHVFDAKNRPTPLNICKILTVLIIDMRQQKNFYHWYQEIHNEIKTTKI